MFHDLCLPAAELVVNRQRLATLMSLGYDAVASSQAANEPVSTMDRSAFQPMQSSELKTAANQTLLRFRECCSLPSSSSAASQQQPPETLPCVQLSRLSASASDPVLPEVWHVIAKTFDLVAIQPKTERAMQQACTSLDCDIISLDMTQRLPFRLRPQLISTAVRRGIYFEILYSGALRDQVSRRHLFCNAQSLTRLLRGGHLVLSSGARNALELRGPYDVINMALLLGITKQQARDAITKNCEAVLAHAAARRLHAGMLQISRLPGAPQPKQPQDKKAAKEGPKPPPAVAEPVRPATRASKRKHAAS